MFWEKADPPSPVLYSRPEKPSQLFMKWIKPVSEAAGLCDLNPAPDSRASTSLLCFQDEHLPGLARLPSRSPRGKKGCPRLGTHPPGLPPPAGTFHVPGSDGMVGKPEEVR